MQRPLKVELLSAHSCFLLIIPLEWACSAGLLFRPSASGRRRLQFFRAPVRPRTRMRMRTHKRCMRAQAQEFQCVHAHFGDACCCWLSCSLERERAKGCTVRGLSNLVCLFDTESGGDMEPCRPPIEPSLPGPIDPWRCGLEAVALHVWKKQEKFVK